MNLWGHHFFQNANQKLQRFLPYPLITFQGRNLCNFWLASWKKQWPHEFILNLTDRIENQQKPSEQISTHCASAGLGMERKSEEFCRSSLCQPIGLLHSSYNNILPHVLWNWRIPSRKYMYPISCCVEHLKLFPNYV